MLKPDNKSFTLFFLDITEKLSLCITPIELKLVCEHALQYVLLWVWSVVGRWVVCVWEIELSSAATTMEESGGDLLFHPTDFIYNVTQTDVVGRCLCVHVSVRHMAWYGEELCSKNVKNSHIDAQPAMFGLSFCESLTCVTQYFDWNSRICTDNRMLWCRDTGNKTYFTRNLYPERFLGN